MRTKPGQLYSLLPAYYRQRDADLKQPLKDLLDVLEAELRVIEQDLEQLYDDWFIETCQDRIVPWIGDLIGVSKGPLGRLPSRAQVAGAIAARRRKGTPAALEFALRTATGWAAYIVEHPPRRVLEITEEIDMVKTGDETIIRETEIIRAPVRAPFGARVEEERSEAEAGDTGGISIYLWPNLCTPREWTVARHLGAGRFTFDPAGSDAPLYNLTQRAKHSFDRATVRTLPIRLSRKILSEDLEAIRNGGSERHGFFSSEPVFQIRHKVRGTDQWSLVPSNQLLITDLADWRSSPSEEHEWDVAVDPELGRMLFQRAPEEVIATWCGISPEVLDQGPVLPDVKYARVYHVIRSVPESVDDQAVYTSVSAALEAWAEQGQNAIIRIHDSGVYLAPHHELRLLDGVSVMIQAVPGQMPMLEGTWRFHATQQSGPLYLEGIRFNGPIETRGPALLYANHCLLHPPASGVGRRRGEAHAHPPALRASDTGEFVEFHLTHCVAGPVEMPTDSGRFFAEGTILDAISGNALRSGAVRLRRCTIFGDVDAEEIEAAIEVIFVGHVSASSQQGQISFCALPREAKTPPRLHCFSPDADGTLPSRWFVSTRFGDAAYAHLSADAPLALQAAAEDGSEPGAYHDLGDRARWALVESVLEEFLPFGLRADVFLVT